MKTLVKIWDFFDEQCGIRLVALIKSSIDYLERSEEPSFGITKEIRTLLKEISGSHADRLLKPVRKKRALRGKSTTKAGTLLKSQIAIKTFFQWDERKPGYFEIDRVAHCGETMNGEFCWTLTATDIYSGWTNGKYKKKYEAPMSPFQRLIACDEIPEEVKTALREELSTQNPVEVKKELDKAVDALLRLNMRKGTETIAAKLAREAVVDGNNFG